MLVVEADESFMCGMHSHNNSLIPEILRFPQSGYSIQTILDKSIEIISDLAALKSIKVVLAEDSAKSELVFGPEPLVLLSNLIATLIQYTLSSTLAARLEIERSGTTIVNFNDPKSLLSSKQYNTLFSKDGKHAFSCPTARFATESAARMGATIQARSAKEDSVTVEIVIPTPTPNPTSSHTATAPPQQLPRPSSHPPTEPQLPSQPHPHQHSHHPHPHPPRQTQRATNTAPPNNGLHNVNGSSSARQEEPIDLNATVTAQDIRQQV